MSEIKIFENIPIVERKHYVLNMNSQITTQTPVFKFTTNYHRYENYIDVPCEFSKLQNCNYCSVENNTELTYFLFVDKIEYISAKNSRLYTHLDSFSTFFNEISWGQCLIVRNHTKTDNLFEHLVQEDIIPQNMRKSRFKISYDFSLDHALYAACPYRVMQDGDKLDELQGGLYYGGIFQGIVYTKLEKDPGAFIKLLAKENKIDSLVSVFHFPESLMPDPNTTDVPREIRTTTRLNYQTINGYKPKNKKCFTYPFYYLTIENGEGEELNIQFEKLENPNQISTLVYGIPTPTASVALLVENYDGAGTLTEYKFSDNNSIFMRNFPQASITSDSYLAWYAMNKNQREASENTQTFNQFRSAAKQTIMGSFLGGVGGAVSLTDSLFDMYNYANEINAKYADAQNLSNVVHGQASADAQWVTHDKSFHSFLNFPTTEIIKGIDDYFTCFGYKIMKIDTPSFNNRPKFTFIQTNGCTIKGKLPAIYKQEIESIVNAGVTVWKTLSGFFDYSGNEV